MRESGAVRRGAGASRSTPRAQPGTPAGAPSPAALVQARGVGRTFRRGENGVVALAAATCRVMPGSRIALVGPSGSGKSTLLHLMAGLDTPTSGELNWPALGTRATLRPGKIGVVFQVPSLLAPLTVVENVELPLLLAEVGGDAARAAARDALARLQLTDLADRLPEELSGGQAQRVAAARALVSHPPLILADEPTGQLDHATARHLFDVLLGALQGSPAALVVATHDPAVAARLDATWRMEHGVLSGAEPW
jgi:putative ABC transport system ATP-binding protein/lipoprotein-releasing system ATP-binding protein